MTTPTAAATNRPRKPMTHLMPPNTSNGIAQCTQASTIATTKAKTTSLE